MIDLRDYTHVHKWELSEENGVRIRTCKKCKKKQFAVRVDTYEWKDYPEEKKKGAK